MSVTDGITQPADTDRRTRQGIRRAVRPASMALTMLALAGCVTPSYVDKDRTGARSAGLNSVLFSVTDHFKVDPPRCIAILPFQAADGVNTEAPEQVFETASEPEMADERMPTRFEEAESHSSALMGSPGGATMPGPNGSVDPVTQMSVTDRVRRAMYAQLSPLEIRDVELSRVDAAVGDRRDGRRLDYSLIGARLGCDAVMVGTVTEYGSNFWGLYSQVVVGADLKVIRTRDGAILWEGSHVARSQDGTVPLTPIDAAMGLVRAASHLHSEQIHRVTDDLARRLVRTIPDSEAAIARVTGSEPNGPRLRYVATKVLNFRAGPGTGYKVQGQLERHDAVEVVGEPMNGEWLPIRTAKGHVGYVSSKYLRTTKTAKLKGSS